MDETLIAIDYALPLGSFRLPNAIKKDDVYALIVNGVTWCHRGRIQSDEDPFVITFFRAYNAGNRLDDTETQPVLSSWLRTMAETSFVITTPAIRYRVVLGAFVTFNVRPLLFQITFDEGGDRLALLFEGQLMLINNSRL